MNAAGRNKISTSIEHSKSFPLTRLRSEPDAVGLPLAMAVACSLIEAMVFQNEFEVHVRGLKCFFNEKGVYNGMYQEAWKGNNKDGRPGRPVGGVDKGMQGRR